MMADHHVPLELDGDLVVSVGAAPAVAQEPKGDPWIIAELREARCRNRIGDNPNLKRGRMFFDFGAGRVAIEDAGHG